MPTIHFSPMKLFLCKRKQTLLGKKKGVEKITFIFFAPHFCSRLFYFFFCKVPLWDNGGTQFLFNPFLSPSSFCVWKGVSFSTHRLLCCTGEFKIRVLGCEFSAKKLTSSACSHRRGGLERKSEERHCER